MKKKPPMPMKKPTADKGKVSIAAMRGGVAKPTPKKGK